MHTQTHFKGSVCVLVARLAFSGSGRDERGRGEGPVARWVVEKYV